MKAFNQAKDIAYRRILNPRNVALAWVRNALEEQLSVLGPDPWEFGLTPQEPQDAGNAAALLPQQGIVRKRTAAGRAVHRRRPGEHPGGDLAHDPEKWIPVFR